ncbi:MAG TPA: T9SS type A sorting domain-containing protein [Ignavibacteria bacterium]|nr:T9SS type A sorting domain-containing protein [Ignavibacteria bacterium]
MKRAYIILLVLLLPAFNFIDTPSRVSNGWVQQVMPDMGGRRIMGMEFLDSLTGIIITDTTGGNSSLILKSTDGGFNWFTVYNDSTRRVYLDMEVNKENGFIYVGSSFILDFGVKLLKSTDKGNSWIRLNNPVSIDYSDISITENEIWTVCNVPFDGGVWQTTNDGLNWERKFYAGLSGNPSRIYMYNKNIGFITNVEGANGRLRKTTDAGISWNIIDTGGFRTMYFVDSLKGFKRGYNGFSKTTNGGVDWILKPLLTGGNIAESELNNFVIQDAIIWGDRGSYWDGVSNIQGLIWKTTNEGDNWGYQLPGINNTYWDISFTNSNFGNASPRLMQSNFSGARTTTGGDTITYYTSVTKINETIPVDFVLYQNFPNPFNPVTNIRYDVKKQSQIILKVYDITGKEIKTLVNQVQTPGTYQVTFEGQGYASGVYIFSLQIDNYKTSIRGLLLK